MRYAAARAAILVGAMRPLRTHASEGVGAPSGMAWIPGGSFRMGSQDFYPEERPVRDAVVDDFWIDDHPVTVAEFRRFVKATGYMTLAERPPDPSAYPDVEASRLVPGSLVFHPTSGPVSLEDHRAWWTYVPGACWHSPEGRGSNTYTRARHPVVHIAHEDALAYARWAGKALPSEAEWERAARGGLDGATFAWGDEHRPDGRYMANTWQGEFPWSDLGLDGHVGTSPVGAFPANGYGLSDVTGNVWEWTADDFPIQPVPGACCAPGPGAELPRKVIKGGSHLCAPNYCLRFRPAARQAQAIDSSTSHLGFRCVLRAASSRAPVTRAGARWC
jgi:formylglycine-generating enzyme required for sulfatase activity